MPKPPPAAGIIGDVLYHLRCIYHGELGTALTPEAANQAAAEHLRDQHRDLEGVVAPGADVQIQAVTHVHAGHFEAIDAARTSLGLQEPKPMS